MSRCCWVVLCERMKDGLLAFHFGRCCSVCFLSSSRVVDFHVFRSSLSKWNVTFIAVTCPRDDSEHAMYPVRNEQYEKRGLQVTNYSRDSPFLAELYTILHQYKLETPISNNQEIIRGEPMFSLFNIISNISALNSAFRGEDKTPTNSKFIFKKLQCMYSSRGLLLFWPFLFSTPMPLKWFEIFIIISVGNLFCCRHFVPNGHGWMLWCCRKGPISNCTCWYGLSALAFTFIIPKALSARADASSITIKTVLLLLHCTCTCIVLHTTYQTRGYTCICVYAWVRFVSMS